MSPRLSGDELARWYWTLAELTGLAREMGVPRGGGKTALAGRLRAALDGHPAEPVAVVRRKGGRQLAGPVDGRSVIPEGQRCSQVLRAFFVREIGPGFHFDAPMRDYIARQAGRTLADAVAHWYATRAEAAEPRRPGAQFEFNRFVQDWHARHPEGSREQALAGWREHRERPRTP